HAEREPWSPFRRLDEFTEVLERQALRFGAVVRETPGPVFVSTPDLLAELPAAHWLPVTIDPAPWARAAVPVMARERPVVVHAPSNPRLKGSEAIETAMAELAARGLVEYRRIEGVPHDRMPAVVGDADIVVDQLVMGLYGVAACEAMAAGRLVVSYVGDPVRAEVRNRTGLEIPIVEANPETLTEVIIALVADRDGAAERAAAGPRFVATLHGGRRSAEALARWLTPKEIA
ncbi:MAG TPA: glycosyl transferase family 1, partial [Kribbella sp.]|nr:glycosyl transferase family 1 [Kribbella sp.]